MVGSAKRTTTIGALILMLSGCYGGNTSTPSMTVTGPRSSVETSGAATQLTPTSVAPPNYSIVATTTSRRFDTKNTYYVVIDRVNLSNDSFKVNVKLVLQALKVKNGSPNFSANVYDDEALAKTAVSQDVDHVDVTAGEIRARSAQEEQHLVAMYDGGIDENAQASTAEDAYGIGWFPAATDSSPNVGQYVEFRERWKP